MKIKTSSLKGAALDWAVAKCEGRCTDIEELDGAGWWVLDGNTDYQYSTRWNAGGPIIEREGISVVHYLHTSDVPWRASDSSSGGEHESGSTPLVAAMRCYVAMKLGAEVDVPDAIASVK